MTMVSRDWEEAECSCRLGRHHPCHLAVLVLVLVLLVLLLILVLLVLVLQWHSQYPRLRHVPHHRH